MVAENNDLRKRNGLLTINNDELCDKLKEAKDKLTKAATTDASIITGSTESQPTKISRPSTAAGAYGRKKEEVQMLDDEDLYLNAQTAFDKELNELLAKNQ